MTDTTTLAAGVRHTVRDLAVRFSDRASEAATLRTMPPDLAADVEAAGLFAAWLPRSLGGLELPAPEIVEIVEELAYGDGGAAWTVLIGQATGFLAWVEPDAARELLGDRPLAASTCVVAPTGRVIAADDGWQASGRWGFNSGVKHAVLGQAAAVIMENGAPKMTPHGPAWGMAYFRLDQAQILETWNSPGLTSSGSHDIVLDGVDVPAPLFVNTQLSAPVHDGPLYRFPVFSNIGVTSMGFPIGIARRALDEFTALAAVKRRGFEDVRVADDRLVQVELARAEGRVQAARAFGREVVGDAWATAVAGDPLSLQQRTRITLAVQHAVRECVAAVDAVWRLAGAGVAVQPDHPLARAFRDLHALDTHVFASADSLARVGKFQLGVEQPEAML